MKWMGLNEIRETYLEFFESKKHIRMQSASLVPVDDKSLLLINSGMAPLKKYFLNLATPPAKRVTTCQKCIRTPDIENVGKTARHGTYFEMLGNFSFGDYFKVEATQWAFEFLVDVLKIPIDKMWISIYESDDEAFDIWTKKVGIDENKIVRLGKEDNFWEIGSGPCGPCSEIYFDRGEKYGCNSKTCGVGCDCDRYVEFWNIVFSQFDSDGKGNYTPMAKPNIDTGMGLERLACIMQEVDNLFLVDTVQNIMSHICKIAKIKYRENEKNDVALRVITDHIRSTTFMVADGVMPSNEGRGYVLRRLLRRAVRYGKLIGIKDLFLYKICKTVIDENKTAYPELLEKKDYIVKVIKVEEERFGKTIDQGMQMLTEILESEVVKNTKTISGNTVFKLYDTFGFPIDLTKEIAEEKGLKVDEKTFTKLMEEQRTKARNARGNSNLASWTSDENLSITSGKTIFVGYETLTETSEILHIVLNNELVGEYSGSEEFDIIVNKTPFYAEGGGQCADIGTIVTNNANINVTYCKKDDDGHYYHKCKLVSGSIKVKDIATLKVDEEFRKAVTVNHTSAHLLQSALKKVLGEHINQAGQSVDNKRVRFDFTHFSALTQQEILQVEQLVNDYVFNAVDIVAENIDINEAKKMGAIALFGEKYGNVVRVVSAKDNCTVEFCGGTHIKNTAQIGVFKILSETSVASGVRRIEAICRKECLLKMTKDEQTLKSIAEVLKTSTSSIDDKIQKLTVTLKEKDKEIQKLNEKMAVLTIKELYNNRISIDDNICYILHFTLNLSNDVLKLMSEKINDLDDGVVAIFVNTVNSKGNVLVTCGKKAVALGYNAGDIVKQVAKLSGGNGGGKKDSAMAGIKNAEILKQSEKEIFNILKG